MNSGPGDAAKFITGRATEEEGPAPDRSDDDWTDIAGSDIAGSDADWTEADWIEAGSARPDANEVVKLTVEQRLGHAVLRLRLYRGWSQRDVQRASGVHQSQICRLEIGKQRGLSVRRLFAILRVLRVDEIAFLPPKPSVPPTELELLLWGDPWERAARAAEGRRAHRRAASRQSPS